MLIFVLFIQSSFIQVVFSSSFIQVVFQVVLFKFAFKFNPYTQLKLFLLQENAETKEVF